MSEGNYDEYAYDQEDIFLNYDDEEPEDVGSEVIESELVGRANSYEQTIRWLDGIETGTLISGLSADEVESLRKVRDEVTVKFRLLEIMKREGVQLRRGAKGGVANCPSLIHPLRSASLRVEDLDSDYFVCEECGASGGVLEFIGLVYGVASLAEQFRLLTGTTLESKVPEKHIKRITQAGKCRREEIFGTVAGVDRVALVYQALVGELECRESHYQEIRRQFSFLSDERFGFLWRERQYRSLPISIEERIEICAALREMDLDLNQVPGFFRIPEDAPDKDTRGLWCFGGDRWGRRMLSIGEGKAEYDLQGFLAPVRNIAGKIVGVELYNDPPPLDAPISVRQLWPQRGIPLLTKYVSHDTAWSATGGTQLHYAPPPDVGCNIYPDGVVVTGGALRADLIATRCDARVIGVPQFGLLTDEMIEVVSLFKRMLILTDCVDKETVERLCRAAEGRGVGSKAIFFDNRMRGGFFDLDLLFGELIRDSNEGYFDGEKDVKDSFPDMEDFPF